MKLKLNPYQLFLGITARLLDLLSTRTAFATNPLAYEAMRFGNIIWLTMSTIIIGVLGLQLLISYFSEKQDAISAKAVLILKGGIWLVITIAYIPVINNLQFI